MSVLQILFPPMSEPVRVPDWEEIRETVRLGPAAVFDWGFTLPEMSMARIKALPEPEWARPQHAEDCRQAYADAETRVAAAMWPQKLPAQTKRITSATVRTGAQVAELLELLAEGVAAIAGMPGGREALLTLVDGEAGSAGAR